MILSLRLFISGGWYEGIILVWQNSIEYESYQLAQRKFLQVTFPSQCHKHSPTHLDTEKFPSQFHSQSRPADVKASPLAGRVRPFNRWKNAFWKQLGGYLYLHFKEEEKRLHLQKDQMSQDVLRVFQRGKNVYRWL